MKERTRQFLMRNYWMNLTDEFLCRKDWQGELFKAMVAGLTLRVAPWSASWPTSEAFVAAERTARRFMNERGVWGI